MQKVWIKNSVKFAIAPVLTLVMATIGPIAIGPIAPQWTSAYASQIKITVNKQAITSRDISRRTSLLRLQRRTGSLNKLARQELIDEALKRDEIIRLRASPSQQEVDSAFARFASNNGLSTRQLTNILSQSGVTTKHFKQFIAIQMGWERSVNARYGQGGAQQGLSRQDLVTKMLELGENKATTTEYILQQVIFVVPQSRRSNSYINRRRGEASKLRQKIDSCDTTQTKTKGLNDVTVRNLGRFMKPELPPEWSPLISKTAINKPTTTRVTDKGVEFIIVCSSRSVSDDKAAEMVFRTEQNATVQSSENEKRYLADLRKRAVIVER